MQILRLVHDETRADGPHVSGSLHQAGPNGTAGADIGSFDVPVEFELSTQDRDDIRWYLEDYLHRPFEPAPSVARRVEERMAQIGVELFTAIFGHDARARHLWLGASRTLAQTRVELISDDADGGSIAWELLRETEGGRPLAVESAAFVHGSTQPSTGVAEPKRPASLVGRLLGAGRADRQLAGGTESAHVPGPVRILIVTARPAGTGDVPFRSVANRVVAGLAGNQELQVTALRPPTFPQLADEINAAQARGAPYDIVHFDGHGMFVDLAAQQAGSQQRKRRGYVIFEEPSDPSNQQLVHGKLLGRTLVDAGVRILVLNACRSALDEPADPSSDGSAGGPVRAFGSFAQEVADAGVPGVVAMRYNVYVDTAARFVAGLYAALAHGAPLGAAATMGRRGLFDDRERSVGFSPRQLHDWVVPVVFEREPLVLLAPRLDAYAAAPVPADATRDAPPNPVVDLPEPPSTGPPAGDDVILAIDRAFDASSTVLLHGPIGSGKSVAAAEFGRWYERTGGAAEPVLYTAFRGELRPVSVLDAVGRSFAPLIQANGIDWAALDDGDRRTVALDVLRATHPLWIWDGIETVAGLPGLTPSSWTQPERSELTALLRSVAATGARVLMTSRREERDLLGDVPRRVVVPPLRMQDRLELAAVVAAQHRHAVADPAAWGPLLEFTQGNPVSIISVVGQACREGLETAEEIADFVRRLRLGASRLDDDDPMTASLHATIDLAIEGAFDDDDRARLALLHLFRGWLQVGTLQNMGDPERGRPVPALEGQSREDLLDLLRRAADVGVLQAYGNWFAILPAVPARLQKLFDRHYPDGHTPDDPRSVAVGSFVNAVMDLAQLYSDQYMGEGGRRVLSAFGTEEGNMVSALEHARTQGRWDAAAAIAQALHALYKTSGRRAEWDRSVDRLAADFVDRATGRPIPGREAYWSIGMEYLAERAVAVGDWTEAERVNRLRVDHNRERVGGLLDGPASNWDDDARIRVRSLAVAIEHFGQLESRRASPRCIELYEEAVGLYERIDDRSAAGLVAQNCATVLSEVPEMRNLDAGERWGRRALELLPATQRVERANAFARLARIAVERFDEGQRRDLPDRELLVWLNEALGYCRQGLAIAPPDADATLMNLHSLMGSIAFNGGETKAAIDHYREAIVHQEALGDALNGAGMRFNLAGMLLDTGRVDDARVYAYSAMSAYEQFGARSGPMIQKTQALLDRIESESKRVKK